MIYLDNAATTYPKPEEVYQALDKANREHAFNAGRGESSQSLFAFKIIEQCKQQLAELVNASPSEIVFTDSATTASNIIINGLDLKDGDVVYVSPFEHNAICRPLNLLKQNGVKMEILDFDSDTLLPSLSRIQNKFAKNPPKAIFISEVSNVTGTIIEFNSIFELGKKYQSINILDSSQAAGLIVGNSYDNVDFQIFAGHKTLYASFGVGGFIVRGNSNLKTVFAGGTGSDSLNLDMPDTVPAKFEFGSPNVVAISGLLSSVTWIKNFNVFNKISSLTEYLYNKLSSLEKVVVYGANSQHIGIVSFNVEGYNPSDVGSILNDEYNISVRTGYHCAPFIHRLLSTDELGGTVRVSLGFFNSTNDIDILIEALKTL